jgi:hypothetical protein
MKTRDLRSLSETIASVVDPIDKERAQMLQEGFLNSLTEKARQIASKEMEDEDEEEDEMEDEGEEEEEKPSSKKKSKMMKEEIELAEKAAPGYEDWASDPKVKASFKKQYGNRWKEVMYGHSWNLAKQEKKVGLDEETLDEAVSAKRMRVIRKYVKGNKRVPEHLKDYMERSFMKKRFKDKQLSDGRGAVGALETRMRRKSAALRAKGVEPKGVAPGYLEEGYQAKRLRIMRKAHGRSSLLTPRQRDFMERSFKKKVARNERIAGGSPAASKAVEIRNQRKAAALRAKGKYDDLAEDTLNEGILKKLRRAKGAAYAAMQKGEGDKYAKLHGVASGLESRYKASMARRGGATQETVRGAGSRLSKKGKYTLKAGKLATQHDNAISRFHTKVRTAELFGRETDKGAKRERQQAQAKFRMDARHGDFGYNDIITPEIKKAGLRARYNYEKKFGRLKGK